MFGYTLFSISTPLPVIVKEKKHLIFKDMHKKHDFCFLKAVKQQSNVIQSDSYRRLYSPSLLHKTFCLFVRKTFHFQTEIPNCSHKIKVLHA